MEKRHLCVSFGMMWPRSRKNLSELFKDREIKQLLAMKAPEGEKAKKLMYARKYAAKFVIESIRYGYESGFQKGLENDARLFGAIAASTSGRECIHRFIAKGHMQGSYMIRWKPEKA
jgi:hypothetical protein